MDVGGTIVDVARYEKFKLPFVNVEWGVAVDRPDGTEKYVMPSESAAREMVDRLATAPSGWANARPIRRHYSDWFEVK